MNKPQQLPVGPGQLIALRIPYVSRCCGTTLVGYYVGCTDDTITISNGNRSKDIPWETVTGTRAAAAGEDICIDI